MKTISQRFEEKLVRVTESGCWIWIGSTNNRGYGQFYDGVKVRLAHRASYAMHVAPLADNDNVLHRCDVPSCVNPAHLFAGSQSDNMQDMKAKRRREWSWTVRGSDAAPSRLSAEQVQEIRSKYSSGGFTQRQLAALYGVTQPAIGAIVRRVVWKHI